MASISGAFEKTFPRPDSLSSSVLLLEAENLWEWFGGLDMYIQNCDKNG